MNKGIKTIIVLAGIGVLGYLAYMKYKKDNKIEPTPIPEVSPEENIESGSAVDPNKYKYLPEERA